MSDYRTQLINSIEQSLVGVLDPETHETVTRKILCILNDYEVTKRCTEVAIYDDANDRLLKRYCACLMVDDKAQSTIYGYRRQIQRFMDFVGRPVTEMGGTISDTIWLLRRNEDFLRLHWKTLAHAYLRFLHGCTMKRS